MPVHAGELRALVRVDNTFSFGLRRHMAMSRACSIWRLCIAQPIMRIEVDDDSQISKTFDAVEQEHEDLLSDIDNRFQDFSPLDERFDLLVHQTYNNRFITDFYDVIAMVFHYHYHWNRVTQKERSRRAIEEHLDCIRALKGGDRGELERACRTHLASARQTLIQSVRS